MYTQDPATDLPHLLVGVEEEGEEGPEKREVGQQQLSTLPARVAFQHIKLRDSERGLFRGRLRGIKLKMESACRAGQTRHS